MSNNHKFNKEIEDLLSTLNEAPVTLPDAPVKPAPAPTKPSQPTPKPRRPGAPRPGLKPAPSARKSNQQSLYAPHLDNNPHLRAALQIRNK